MKTFFLVLILCANSCISLAQGDTLNRLDSVGKRYGWWKLDGKRLNYPEYKPDETVEEGRYLNNMKTGPWRHYYPGGELENELIFVNNRPRGPARLYYSNGCISESGYWKNNRWVGDYLLYSRDSCGKAILAYCFDTTGRSDKVIKTYPYFEHEPDKETGVITEAPYYRPAQTGNGIADLKGKLRCPLRDCRVKQPENHPWTFCGPTPGVRLVSADSTVFSVTEGIVTGVKEIVGIGYIVIVRNGDYLFVYQGLGKVKVQEGQVVKISDTIGMLSREEGTYEMEFQVWRGQEKQESKAWLACTSGK